MTQGSGKFGLVLGKDRHKFSAAHMTVFPDGSKERLHGHNFQVEVAVDLASARFECFLDFRILERIVAELCSRWDDRLLLAAENRFFKIIRHDEKEIEFLLSGKRYVVPSDEIALLPVDNIAVESLAGLFADLFLEEIPVSEQESVLAFQVTVAETPGQAGTCRRELGPF